MMFRCGCPKECKSFLSTCSSVIIYNVFIHLLKITLLATMAEYINTIILCVTDIVCVTAEQKDQIRCFSKKDASPDQVSLPEVKPRKGGSLSLTTVNSYIRRVLLSACIGKCEMLLINCVYEYVRAVLNLTPLLPCHINLNVKECNF